MTEERADRGATTAIAACSPRTANTVPRPVPTSISAASPAWRSSSPAGPARVRLPASRRPEGSTTTASRTSCAVSRRWARTRSGDIFFENTPRVAREGRLADHGNRLSDRGGDPPRRGLLRLRGDGVLRRRGGGDQPALTSGGG